MLGILINIRRIPREVNYGLGSRFYNLLRRGNCINKTCDNVMSIWGCFGLIEERLACLGEAWKGFIVDIKLG